MNDSISVTLTKKTVTEEMSMYRASLKDADFRRIKDPFPVSISTEEIREGDTFLDTYTVTSKAFSGGMGSVWRVRHHDWNISLAMKRPHPEYFAEGSRKRKEEFIAECENWISLGLHPYIVSCYYVREIGGVPSVFSEWMDGGSLKDRIRDGSLYQGTEEEISRRILTIAAQSAGGLKYAHEKGLIHRDVKPGNILLTKEWDAKAADFGLAKAESRLAEEGTARSRGYTEAYCPKEQKEGNTPETWMDVYAWALSVLAMYAGEIPWESGSDAFDVVFGSPVQWRVQPPAALLEAFREDYSRKDHCSSGTWRDFNQMEYLIKEIYKKETGSAYPEESWKAAADTADSLNNTALSYADLGMHDTAGEYWQKAMAADPAHFESCISEGLFLWRNGEIADLQMEERILYFGTVYENTVGGQERQELYRGIREQFYQESTAGSEHFTETGFVSRDQGITLGRAAPEWIDAAVQRKLTIRTVHLKQEQILFEMFPAGSNENGMIFSFDIRSGECLGFSETAEPLMETEENAPEGEFRFRMKETEQDSEGRGMYLQIIEPEGRILRSVLMENWDAYRDEEGIVRYVYPLMLKDYAGHRIIFASLSEWKWKCCPMPVPKPEKERMTYLVSRPVSFKKRSIQDKEREICCQAFQNASSDDDFSGMRDAYERILRLPLTGDNRMLAGMNSRLMEQCRLPGIRLTDHHIEVRITAHDPADPLPCGAAAFLPLRREEEIPEDLLRDFVFRKDRYGTAWFFPSPQEAEPSSVEIRVHDKDGKTTVRRSVSPELSGWHISRVIAVSSLGHYLLLELRQGAEDFKIVCMTMNGRRVMEITEGFGDIRLNGILLEDGQLGPDRGYLYQPGTKKIMYFEREEERFYTYYSAEKWPVTQYSFPLPEVRYPEVTEEVMLSSDGERMAVLCRGEEGDPARMVLYLFLKERGRWNRYPFGRSQRIIMDRELRHILRGRTRGNVHALWSWELFPAEPEIHQKPLRELMEFTEISRIRFFSDDGCCLLDENGMPVYAVCWQYEEGY